MGLWLENGPQNYTNSSRRVLGFTNDSSRGDLRAKKEKRVMAILPPWKGTATLTGEKGGTT